MNRVRRLPIKNTAFIGLVTLLAAVLVITLFVRLASASCSQEYQRDKLININGQTVTTQVAETSAELSKGLGGKSCIGDNQAMLFIFGRPGDYAFWMKNMKFPIDIVWINSKHEVVQIQSNVSPKTYPESFSNAQPAKYVLELKAGRTTELGVREGNLIDL